MPEKCEIQLGYVIGLTEPVSVMIETFGTEKKPIQELYDFIAQADTRPEAIIRKFGLRRPIYTPLSCYGHFGENAADMPWEKTDLVVEFAKKEEL